jgi:hypothetical protein
MRTIVDALPSVGVSILARWETAPHGASPFELFSELYFFCGDSCTSRYPLVRTNRAQWFADQLATLGDGPRYLLMHPAAKVAEGGALRRIEVSDPDWLARAWPGPGHLLLFSDDGTRVLSLHEIAGVDDLIAQALSTDAALAMRAERRRLNSAFTAASIVRIASSQQHTALRTAPMVEGDATFTLPMTSSRSRRIVWIEACVTHARIDLDGCDLSFARTEMLVSLHGSADAAAIATLWETGGHDRLVLVDRDRVHVLAFSCIDGRFEARIRSVGA